MAMTRLSVLLFLLQVYKVLCQDVPYTNCDKETYYSDLQKDPLQWTLPEISSLLKTTHRGFLRYTDNNSKIDVWRALIDLDRGADEGTVHLLYKDIDVPAEPFGTPATWNREHVWPKSRGVETEGRDYTDIHHLRPSDWNVNSARGNKYFGNCEEGCSVPASNEAAPDTASSSDFWMPPASVRGDIARILMYMDVRYSPTEFSSFRNEEDLILTNCLTNDPNEMGRLSDLLQWHIEDPPSPEERERNDRACSQWQGNRNPFVDFPELSDTIFAQDRGCADNNTEEPPKPPPIPPTSKCPVPGSIMIIGVNTDDPDTVTLVALSDLVVGQTIQLTDNAWIGTSFRTNEGTVQLTLPENVPSGTIFGFGGDDTLLFSNLWTGRNPALSTGGDNVIVYCQDQDNIIPLSAISLSGDWLEANLPEADYGTGKSALPDGLEDYAVALPHLDNYQYVGITEGSPSDIQRAITLPQSWAGSDTQRLALSTSFSVDDLSSSTGNGNLQKQNWPSLIAMTLSLLVFVVAT